MNLSLRPLLLALAGATLLCLTTCKTSKPKVDTTAYDIPYAKDACEPTLAYYADPRESGTPFVTVPEKYNFGGAYEAIRDRGLASKQFRLAIPSDGEATLRIYNNSPYGYYLRAIAFKTEGELALLEDFSYHHQLFNSIELKVDTRVGFRYILVEIYPQSTGDQGEVSEEAYLGLVAYDDEVTKYPAYSPRERPLDCDETTSLCYVLSSCDRSINLRAWAESLGLDLRDEIELESGENPNVATACLPPGFTMNVRDLNGKKGTIKRDTTNGSGAAGVMENNFIIKLPALQRGNSKEEEQTDPVADKLACLKFEPENGKKRRGELSVTIIDSGVSAKRDRRAGRDPIFRKWDEYAIADDRGRYLQRGALGYDFYRGDNDPDEEIAHGTTVAATVANSFVGRRKGRLSIVHHKIFNEDGEATYFGALEAIYAAADERTDVLNLSWGIPMEEAPVSLGCAIRYALDAGTLVVTSAGNDKTDITREPQWPAAYTSQVGYEGLFSVGSFDLSDNRNLDKFKRAGYSNYGKSWVSLYTFKAALVPVEFGNRLDYAYGTSISAPLFAGYLLSRGAENANLMPPPGRDRDLVRWVKRDFFDPNDLDYTSQNVADHSVHVLDAVCPTGED